MLRVEQVNDQEQKQKQSIIRDNKNLCNGKGKGGFLWYYSKF